VNAGQIEKAYSVASSSDNVKQKVVKYLVNKDQFDEALKQAQIIEKKITRALAMGLIARSLAKAFQYDRAREVAVSIGKINKHVKENTLESIGNIERHHRSV
jgi:hypothetical protein